MLTIRQRLVRGYGYAIYIDGTRKFDNVHAIYHDEVKAYAAANFSADKLEKSLSIDNINESEYLDTLALVGSDVAQSWKGI